MRLSRAHADDQVGAHRNYNYHRVVCRSVGRETGVSHTHTSLRSTDDQGTTLSHLRTLAARRRYHVIIHQLGLPREPKITVWVHISDGCACFSVAVQVPIIQLSLVERPGSCNWLLPVVASAASVVAFSHGRRWHPHCGAATTARAGKSSLL